MNVFGRDGLGDRLFIAIRRRPERLIELVLVILVVVVPVATDSEYLASVGGIVAFNATLALTATLLIGYGGQFSFGFPIFVGTGAYISSWMATHSSVPVALDVLAAGIVTAVLGILLSFPALRIRGLPLGILTLGLVLSGDEIFSNLGGADGVAGIPQLYLGGLVIGDVYLQLFVYVGVLVLTYFAVSAIVHGRFGRMLLLMKADEDTALSVGIRVIRQKELVFGAHALMLGILGGLYPFLLGYVGPALFPLDLALDIFFAAVLGGLLFPEGAIIGALIFSAIPIIAGSQATNIEPVVYGALLLFVLIVLPNGLLAIVPRARQKRRTILAAAPQPGSVVHEAIAPEQTPRIRSGEPILRVEHVSKQFGGLRALRDVSFELGRGEIVGLIGNNGAGKSTCINIVAGFLKPNGGHVEFKGIDIDRWAPDRRAKAGLHRTFQFPSLVDELSVAENLMAAGEAMHPIFRRPGSTVAELMETILDALGLTAIGDLSVGEVSLGMQKVVDVGRSLMTHPDALLLDEPAAGLAPVELPFMRSALALAREEGLSLLIVEHNVAFVSQLADRLVVLDFGAVLAEGAPDDVLKQANVVESYLGHTTTALAVE